MDQVVFPTQIHLGGRSVSWGEKDLDDWMSGQVKTYFPVLGTLLRNGVSAFCFSCALRSLLEAVRSEIGLMFSVCLKAAPHGSRVLVGTVVGKVHNNRT